VTIEPRPLAGIGPEQVRRDLVLAAAHDDQQAPVEWAQGFATDRVTSIRGLYFGERS